MKYRSWLLVILLLGVAVGAKTGHVLPLPSQAVGLWESSADGAKIKLEKRDGCLDVRWTGGYGHSKISYGPKAIEPVLSVFQEHEERPVKLVFRIGYDRSDYGQLQSYLFYDSSQVSQPCFFRLKQGVHDYEVSLKRGHRLHQIQLRGGVPSFVIHGVSFVGQSCRPTHRAMVLDCSRKTREVLYDGGAVIRDFVVSPALASAKEPLSLRICVKGDTLEFESVAEQSVSPKSLALRRDSSVWADDALELFFAPLLDNRGYAQIAFNAAGTVYDGEYGYDPVAAKFCHRTSVDYEVKTASRHQDGKLHLKATLGMKQLQMDLKRCPVIGFQAGQNFVASKSYASWNGASSNLVPHHYGLLYFNRRPFGAGRLVFQDVRLEEQTGVLQVKLSSQGFAKGIYDLKLWVTHPDHSIQRLHWKRSLSDGGFQLEFPLAKDFNGVYSLLLMVTSEAGAVKPFVVNFTNQKKISFPYGQKVLFPAPKKVAWKEGRFLAGEHSTLGIVQGATARTRLTAELLQRKLLGRGLNYAIEEGKTTGGIQLQLVPGLCSPEGYQLKVTPQEIRILATDEAGLFYGTVTLMQLMTLDMRRQNAAPVPCVEITDSPDLRHRVAPLWFPDQLAMPIKDPVSLDFLLDYLDRFVAGNKMNILKIRGFETVLRYDDIPKVNYAPKNRNLTWADMTRLSEFCRERFIDLMIALPGGGHDYWITSGNKEFVSKGYDSGNVSDPDYLDIYFKVAGRLIDATHCKYFTAESDEWWHWRNPKIEVLPERINGKLRKEIFLDFHLKLHDFLKRRGVRLAMYEDMINPLHNGPKFGTHDIVDQLPRDIIINIWADLGNATEFFGDKGFECWGSTTGWLTFNGKSRKYITGFGASLYGFGHEWKFHNRDTMSFHSIWFLGANYAWNFQNQNMNWNYSDVMNGGKLTAAECVFAEQDNFYGDEQIEVLELKGCTNAKDQTFLTGRREICHIPTKIPEDGGCIVTDGTIKGSVIPVGKCYSSLIFLHSAIPGKAYGKGKEMYNNRQWPLGYPVAEYRINYENGETVRVPIRLNMNVYFESHQPQAGAPVFCRGMDIAYNEKLHPFFRYQFEWVNPRPKEKIMSITTAAPWKFDFQHKLFAVSGRRVRH